MAVTWLLLSIVAVLVSLYVWLRLAAFCRRYKHLPRGDYAHFLFGDATIFVKAFLGFYELPLYAVAFKFFNEMLAEHKDKEIGLFWLGWYPVAVMMHPKHVERLLTANEAIEKAPEYRYLHRWLGTGLLTAAGHKWKERRRMLSPAFHFRILNDFVPIINEQSQVMVDSLAKTAGQEIDLFEYVPYAALDVICETAMGVNIKSQSNAKTSYVKAVMLQSEVVFNRLLNPLMPDWIFSRTAAGKKHRKSIEMLHAFTLRVINEKIQERSRPGHRRDQQDELTDAGENLYLSGRKRLAFMDLLVDAYLDQSPEGPAGQPHIDIEGIREEVDTFMFEGFDTTAAAVSWIIFLLGHNPDCQQRLLDEIEQLLGPVGQQPAHIDQKCLAQFKYLEACVKEGLRLFPSVPLIGRRPTADLQYGPYLVPRHTTSVVYLYGLHRDEKVFPQPERYWPERFLAGSPDEAGPRHAFAYLPFSAGQRNCIGQKFAMVETKVMVLYLVRAYLIRSMVPLEQVSICIELITRPKSKLAVQFTPRQ